MENQEFTASSKSTPSNSAESFLWTRCVNDDSDGSILSDWMDHDSDQEELEKVDLKELTTSQYLINPDVEEGKRLGEVKSEYAFDINSY